MNKLKGPKFVCQTCGKSTTITPLSLEIYIVSRNGKHLAMNSYKCSDSRCGVKVSVCIPVKSLELKINHED